MSRRRPNIVSCSLIDTRSQNSTSIRISRTTTYDPFAVQAGHIFIAYQQDVERQFETIQKRLINEPLVDYVQPFGGGYFFTLPGVRDANDWYGKTMLA